MSPDPKQTAKKALNRVEKMLRRGDADADDTGVELEDAGHGAAAGSQPGIDTTGPTRLYDAYVFDLDGTIFLGDEAMPGAGRTIEMIRQLDRPVRFVSNNATLDPDGVVAKLAALGVDIKREEFTNTVISTVAWLRANHPQAVVFPIAEEPLKHALAEAGIAMSQNPEEIDIVIASYDRTFDYRKLQIAFDAIWFHKRAFLVATNMDTFCPYPGGRGEPDAATIVSAIETGTGTKLVQNLGKPDAVLLEAALADLDADLSRSIMIGDRLGTDIKMANKAGMDSALVLTGDNTLAEAESVKKKQRPDFALSRLDHIIPEYIREQMGWLDSDS